MKLRHLAAAVLALGAACAAHANVLTFDNPGLIDISDTTATYTEASFSIRGQAADFLLLDNGAGNGFLVGGFMGAAPFSLVAAGGGAFSLAGFDLGYYDLGDTPGTVTVSGLFAGAQVAAMSFVLSGSSTPASFSFAGPWARLTEVRFSATSGFTLDNINVSAVPEPASLALLFAGLGAVGLTALRRG